LLRVALKAMVRSDLIGIGKHHLIPALQPIVDDGYCSARRKNSTAPGDKRVAGAVRRGTVLTQHTGLPPRGGVKRRGAG
ncbi:MAG: DUF3362 domain-containing protein, partial [Burkholderiaceae bacterium]|nr:DUF3362 domain-containing protein [Burkholderiaceae bacterium]